MFTYMEFLFAVATGKIYNYVSLATFSLLSLCPPLPSLSPLPPLCPSFHHFLPPRLFTLLSLPPPAEFCHALEEDARERGERRKEREVKGKAKKKRGNEAFRRGEYASSIEHFTEAIAQTPWDISLYTNRALVGCTSLLHWDRPIESTVNSRLHMCGNSFLITAY